MRFWNSSKKTFQVFSKMMTYLRLSNLEGANYPKLKNRYMRELLNHLRLDVQIINEPDDLPSPAIFVCNHISYLDIPILMSKISQASFVSKAEVANWPIIGQAANRVGTVFVKRGCKKSRQEVRQTIANAIVKENKSVAVFPSGTTKIVKSETWRRGVFEIAKEHGIPVVPLRINYTPLRKAAYIDNDNFVLHLFDIMAGEPLKVSVEFGEPRKIEDVIEDATNIHLWCEQLMTAPDKTTEAFNSPATAPIPG